MLLLPAGTVRTQTSLTPIASRACVVLGVACRCFSDGLVEVVGLKFVEAVFRRFTSLFSRSCPDPTHVRLVTAICDIVAGSPKYAATLQKDGILASMLGHPHDNVRAKALSMWAEIVATAAAIDVTPDGEHMLSEQKLAFDDNSCDSTYLVANATQAQIPQILDSMHTGSAEARTASLTLLSTVLRHGLVNPLDAVPKIIASLADASKTVSRGAARMLYFEHEKRPRYVSARFVEGIVLCFRLCAASGRTAGEHAYQALSSAYVRCIQRTKTTRYSVLRRFVGLFEQQHVAILQDMSSLIAALRFASCDEPLFVIYHVTRQMALIREDEIHKFLQSVRSQLQHKYRLSDNRIETYIPK